jgi:hypothetical protein
MYATVSVVATYDIDPMMCSIKIDDSNCSAVTLAPPSTARAIAATSPARMAPTNGSCTA